MKKLILFLGLVIALLFGSVPTNGADVTKLVRIQQDDNWVYDINEIRAVNLTVTSQSIDKHNREFSALKSNDSFEILMPYLTYQYSPNFSISITVLNSQLSITSRGGFLHSYEGEATVNVTFNGTSHVFNHTNNLWGYPDFTTMGEGSHNLAIVTGEPQFLTYFFTAAWSEYRLDLSAKYRLVPGDPTTTQWQGKDVTTVSLSEYLHAVEGIVRTSDMITTIEKGEILEPSNTYTKYVYAEEIGLPIEIQRNIPVSSSKLSLLGLQTTELTKLVDYTIKEAKKLANDSDSPGFLWFTIIALPLLVIVKKVLKNR